MKIHLLLVCIHLIFTSRSTIGSAIRAPLDVISLDDISPEERKELDYLHQKYGRPKRSGSGSGSSDILESLKLAIGQGIKNKIGEFAKGSAAATARLSSSSSGSSGHGYSYHSPPPPESHDHKSLDFWSLKKSILNTLLQAVKAIKGGVIAVKGQLIKGGGYLTAATGKLIVAKGDAVTNLGKKIASSAVLVPYHGHPSSHAEYGPPPESHYSAPSAPEDFYHGAPSAPAPEFHGPDHHYPYHDDEGPHKGPSGLLVLKKIGDQHYHHHHPAETKIPPFKPIEHSGPSFGTILGKFLSASSSLDPHKPEPFGDTAPAEVSSYHSHPNHYYDASESQNHQHQVAPGASGYLVNDEDPTEPDSPVKEPSDDSPFEREPSYLHQHFDEYVGSASKTKPQAVKTNSIPQEEKPSTLSHQEPPKSFASPQTSIQNNFEYPSLNVQTLGTAPASSATNVNSGYGLYNLPNIGDYPNGFPGSLESLAVLHSAKGELPTNQNLFYPSQPPSVIDLTKDYVQPQFDSSAENSMSQQEYSNEIQHYYHYPQTSIQGSHSANNYPPASIQGSHSGKSYPPASIQGSHSVESYPPASIHGSHRVESYPPASIHGSHSGESYPPASIQGSQSLKQYVPVPSPHSNRRPTRLTHESSPNSSKHRTKSTRTKYPTTYKRPSSSTRTAKHKPKQTYDVVKSIAYELGPNGPKRLT